MWNRVRCPLINIWIKRWNDFVEPKNERKTARHTHTLREKKNRWAYNGNETEKKHTQKNVWWSTYCMCYAVCVLGSRFVCALFCSLVCKKKDKRKENGMYENKNNRRKKKSCNEPVRMRANQMYNSSTITTFFFALLFLISFPFIFKLLLSLVCAFFLSL